MKASVEGWGKARGGPRKGGGEGRLGRLSAALESDFSMVFARAFAYMD
ncbi:MULTISPECIES: hypothetical protein [Paraburkholderia]|jgi:hypothetical protein|nr:hypothetical protein [Paraburkholderia phenazinium]